MGHNRSESIDLLINAIPKTADSDVKVEIDPSLWQVEVAYKKLFKDFECPICYNVAWAPASCAGCHKIFCTKCINAHMKTDKKCPVCRVIFDVKNY